MSKQTELAQVADTITVDSGNVGIGTSSPAWQLHVKSTSNAVVQIEGASSAGSFVNFGDPSDTDVGQIGYDHTSNYMRFKTNDTERMRIDSSGDLRVGNTSGSWPSVDGCILQGGGILQASINNSASLYLNRGSSNGNIAQFARSGTTVGGISVTASSTSFNTSSDYRLKENVTDVTDGITRVKQLSPKRFNFIVDPDKTVDGFIAHEAQSVVPEAVTGTHDGMVDEEYEVTPAVLDDDGNEVTPAVMGTRSVPDYQGIDQSKLVPLLTAALQEALTKIDDLETRLTALEAV